MAGLHQQLRYSVDIQTGRHCLTGSVGKHGSSQGWPLKSTWPSHVIVDSYFFTCLAYMIPLVRKQSLTLNLCGSVRAPPPPPTSARPPRTRPSAWPSKNSRPSWSRRTSSACKPTCSSKSQFGLFLLELLYLKKETAFSLRVKGKKWIWSAFDSVAESIKPTQRYKCDMKGEMEWTGKDKGLADILQVPGVS